MEVMAKTFVDINSIKFNLKGPHAEIVQTVRTTYPEFIKKPQLINIPNLRSFN